MRREARGAGARRRGFQGRRDYPVQIGRGGGLGVWVQCRRVEPAPRDQESRKSHGLGGRGG